MTSCSFCGSLRHQPIYAFDSYQILRCQHCGLLSRDKHFSRQQLKRVFSKKYFLTDQKNYFQGCFTKPDPRDARIIDFTARLKQLNRHFPRHWSKKKKSLLDVGCATGVFMDLARQQGWRVQGVEISSFAADFAKNQLKLPVTVGSLENVQFKSNFFPVITVWEVLPYLETPDRFFQKLNRILVPGGIVGIQLTVVDSLLHSVANAIYRLSLRKITGFLKRGYPKENAHHFTRATTRAFLKKHGFKIIIEQNIEIDYRLSALPKKFLPLLYLISSVSQLTGKTVQYRVIAKKIAPHN